MFTLSNHHLVLIICFFIFSAPTGVYSAVEGEPEGKALASASGASGGRSTGSDGERVQVFDDFISGAVSIPAQVEKSPVYQALANSREIVTSASGDLSGDGRTDWVVAFRDKNRTIGTRGGIAVFSSRLGRIKKVYAGQWNSAFPRAVKITGSNIDVVVVEITDQGEVSLEQNLKFGKDIIFDDAPGGVLENIRIEASSTLKHIRAETDPEYVLDEDLTTGWSEAGIGTGIGEWIRLTFSRPIAISKLGIATGDNRSKEFRQRSNRLHRAEIVVRTPAEEGDPLAGVSFRDLGLDFPGERIPVRMADREGVQYFSVDRNEVSSIEIRISSVYVGDRLDDTWINIVDVIGKLPDPEWPSFVVSPLGRSSR